MRIKDMDGNSVKVGDFVGFKPAGGTETYGRVRKIDYTYGALIVDVWDSNTGEDTRTMVIASECWKEG